MNACNLIKLANLQSSLKILNSSFTRQTPLFVTQTQQRTYWRPKKARAPYTKELDFSYAGDKSDHVVKVDMRDPRPGFEEMLKKYEDDDVIQKMFSMQYGNHCEVLHHMVAEVVAAIQDHPVDLKSIEVTVAKDTVLIRNQIKHCVRFRHDNFSIIVLRNRISRRNDALGELLAADKEKFDWLTQKLGLKYTAPKRHSDFLSKIATRKKAARDATIALIRSKNESLKAKLDVERVRFEELKASELEAIEEKLKDLGIMEMNSISEVLEALGHQEMTPRKEVIPSRAQLILQKKMEAFMPAKRVADDLKLTENNFLTPSEMPEIPNKLFY